MIKAALNSFWKFITRPFKKDHHCRMKTLQMMEEVKRQYMQESLAVLRAEVKLHNETKEFAEKAQA